jgi:hypothetical protein
MTPLLRPLLQSIRALVLGLTVLCLLAQPVLAAAHEMHDAEHALVDGAGADHGVPADADASEPGTFDGFLHAFDCCLHATAVPAHSLFWTPHRLQALPPRVTLPAHTPSTSSRFLRPPIAA